MLESTITERLQSSSHGEEKNYRLWEQEVIEIVKNMRGTSVYINKNYIFGPSALKKKKKKGELVVEEGI